MPPFTKKEEFAVRWKRAAEKASHAARGARYHCLLLDRDNQVTNLVY